MTQAHADFLDRALKWGQFALAVIALIGALVYAGRRSERDEQQTVALDKMASELGKIQQQATTASAELRVFGERLRMLEERVARIESR